MHIILASGSSARARMLKDAGIDFEITPAAVDESLIRAEFLSNPSQELVAIAMHLAEAKAQEVSERHPQAMVIGADQILVFEDEILTKPKDLEMARQQLLRLRWNEHQLVSAAACACAGEIEWQSMGTAKLTMRDFSTDFIDQYLAAMGRRVTTTVGGYEIEGLGIQLFSEIRGDLFTIQGLPLLNLLDFLRSRGLIPA